MPFITIPIVLFLEKKEKHIPVYSELGNFTYVI